MNLSDNSSIIPVFPEAFIYNVCIDVSSNKILEYLKKIKFNLTKYSDENKNACYISENLNVFNDLNFLKNKIEENVKHYLYNVFEYKMDYKFLNSWATKVEIGGFSQKHSHRNTFLSGVYYPLGNKDFKIKFYKENLGFWDIKTNNINFFNLTNICFNIEKDNTLLLFPSSLTHSIEKNISGTDRYSIAFNINPSGYIGESDNGIIF